MSPNQPTPSWYLWVGAYIPVKLILRGLSQRWA